MPPTIDPETGRLPASVYRRRRLTLLLAVVAVIVVVVLMIVRPGAASGENPTTEPTATADAGDGDAADPDATADPTADATGEPVDDAGSDDAGSDESGGEDGDSGGSADPIGEPVSGDDGWCSADDITVTAKTDKQHYASGQKPKLSFTIKNVGDAACTLDVGTLGQEWAITSGGVKVWNSIDCASGGDSQAVELKKGKSLTSAALTWNRTLSSSDACATDAKRTKAGADGAAYTFEVTVGGFTSAKARTFYLD